MLPRRSFFGAVGVALVVASGVALAVVGAGCDITVCEAADGATCCNSDDDCGVSNQLCGDAGVCEVRTVDGVTMVVADSSGGITTFDAAKIGGTFPMALFGRPEGDSSRSLSGYYNVLGVAEGGRALSISLSDLAGQRDACPEGIQIAVLGGDAFTTADGACGSLEATLDDNGNIVVSWLGTEGRGLGLMFESAE